VYPVREAFGGAVRGCFDSADQEGVAVGIEVVGRGEHTDGLAVVGSCHVVAGAGWAGGVAGGEDAGDDVGLGDVAVGVGGEVVQCVVGVDHGGAVARCVG